MRRVTPSVHVVSLPAASHTASRAPCLACPSLPKLCLSSSCPAPPAGASSLKFRARAQPVLQGAWCRDPSRLDSGQGSTDRPSPAPGLGPASLPLILSVPSGQAHGRGAGVATWACQKLSFSFYFSAFVSSPVRLIKSFEPQAGSESSQRQAPESTQAPAPGPALAGQRGWGEQQG